MHSVCFLVYLFINLKKFYFETKLCYMSLAGLELAAGNSPASASSVLGSQVYSTPLALSYLLLAVFCL